MEEFRQECACTILRTRQKGSRALQLKSPAAGLQFFLETSSVTIMKTNLLSRGRGLDTGFALSSLCRRALPLSLVILLLCSLDP